MPDLYTTLVFVHVLSAAALVGHSIGAPAVHRWIRETDNIEALRSALEIDRRLARLNPVTALVLLATGVYLGWAGNWWAQAWFWIAVAAWVVNSFLAARVLQPAAGALAAAASVHAGGRVSADVDRLRQARTPAMAGQVMLANDLTVLYAMIAKPTLAQSLIVLAASYAICLLPLMKAGAAQAPRHQRA